jgi:squalene-hopene/tetraprenyl-beta-curcumene cyclase
LPFDRSGADLTAHALRAWAVWQEELEPAFQHRVQHAIEHGVRYLAREQRADGGWVPLWFGNEFHPEEENPTYGTARVLSSFLSLATKDAHRVSQLVDRGVQWLLAAQNGDGGWGGAPDTPSSLEETALAVEALASRKGTEPALAAGVDWLIRSSDRGRGLEPAPIGFYFAKLWYYEKLYPLIHTVAALGRVDRLLAGD